MSAININLHIDTEHALILRLFDYMIDSTVAKSCSAHRIMFLASERPNRYILALRCHPTCSNLYKSALAYGSEK